MTLTQRDKRALILLGMAAAVTVIYIATSPKDTPAVVAAATQESIPAAEQRLARMRQSVALVPGRTELLDQATAELLKRERGLIEAETGPQATEQLLGIVRKIARAQAPPVEVRSVELGQPAPFGEAYGQVTVAASMECGIEQLVNMLADISARPELIATNDLRIAAANPKEKTVNVRLSVTGLVPRKLVPKKKETTF